MLPNDIFCRSVIDPKHFGEKGLDPEKLLSFRDVDSDRRLWRLSVASEWLCRSEAGVHRFGEGVAKGMTKQRIDSWEKKGRKGEEPGACTYVGYYSVFYDDVARVRSNHYSSTVKWVLENGDERHCEIRLHFCGHPGTSKQDRNAYMDDMKAARNMLFTQLFGPSMLPNVEGDPKLEELQSVQWLPILERQIGQPA